MRQKQIFTDLTQKTLKKLRKSEMVKLIMRCDT